MVKLSKLVALKDRKTRKLSKKLSEIIDSTTVESKGKFEIKLKMNWHFCQGQFAKIMFTHVEVFVSLLINSLKNLESNLKNLNLGINLNIPILVNL